MWHTGTGKIIYDPYRPGLKHKGKDKWWVIVDVDKEITRYYRWWVKKQFWLDLCKPSWDAHISIIRGEKPADHLLHLWKKYHGQTIEFQYSHDVRQTGIRSDRPDHYWFVDVDAPVLNDIRTELERPTGWKFHLTIGRTW